MPDPGSFRDALEGGHELTEDLFRDQIPEALIDMVEDAAESVAGRRGEPAGDHSAFSGRTTRREERPHLSDHLFAVQQFASICPPFNMACGRCETDSDSLQMVGKAWMLPGKMDDAPKALGEAIDRDPGDARGALRDGQG